MAIQEIPVQTQKKLGQSQPSSDSRGEAWRATVRFMISVFGAAGTTRLLWTLVPTKLAINTDIVGYPVFADFNPSRYTYGYLFFVLIFPALSLIIYTILARRGPLQKQVLDKQNLLPIVSVGETDTLLDESTSDDGAFRTIHSFWTVAKVGLVAATVALEASVIAVRNQRLGSGAYVAGFVLFGGVLAFGILLSRTSGKRGEHARNGYGGRSWSMSVAQVNSFAALSVIPLLYFVSRGTNVVIGPRARSVRYPWLPLWLVMLLLLVAFLLWLRGYRKARTLPEVLELEAKVLTWVVGPVAFFLVVASLPGAFGPFQAFDDAHFLAAPQLIFQHGLFPWRDIYVLHGLLADVLFGKVGMAVFGNSRWGVGAGFDILVNPMNLLALYVFAAYFCRKNRLVLVLLTLTLATGVLQPALSGTRFMLLPITLILLDQVLRQPGWGRSSLFMSVLFAGTILTPEEALFVPCLVGTVALFDLTTHPSHLSMSSRFRGTWRCLMSGAVLTGVWLVFLTATKSTTAFIDYFLDFASGHGVEGALPTQWSLSQDLTVSFYWVLPTVLCLATFWKVAAKLRRRSSWTTREWVMVGSAACAGIYFPKALERADVGHVFETVVVAIPLLILWSIEILTIGDRKVRSISFHGRRVIETLGLRHAVTGLAVLAVIVGSSEYPTAAVSVSALLRRVPTDFHPSVTQAEVSSAARLGYTLPGSVDLNQIQALNAILHRYAGINAPVFDYANEPGILYYLLNRVPGTRFYYSAIVQTELAQNQVIGDLRHSRPPLVVFDDTTFGLVNYDGVQQSIRSPEVSLYLFGHYRPLLDVQGQLVLLRDDLFATAPPVPPGDSTSELYFDAPSCTFGDIPNFYSVPSGVQAQKGVRLSAQQIVRYGFNASGWAVANPSENPASEVLAVANGRVISYGPTGLSRPDVAAALHDPHAATAGFSLPIPKTNGPVVLYVLNDDETVSPLTPGQRLTRLTRSTGTTVTTPDGVVHQIDFSGRGRGSVDAITPTSEAVFRVTAPRGVPPSSYSWMRVSVPKGLDNSGFTITDQLSAPSSHWVQFNTLRSARNSVYVRVGSCLQWHGYSNPGGPFLVETGGLKHFDLSLIH
jgi:hypothetical protein